MEIKIIDLATKIEYSVTVRSGGETIMVCPVCSDGRKKEKTKCMSFNSEKEVGHCNHCDARFVKKRDFAPTKEYKRPIYKPNTGLSANVVKWFAGRGIKEQTLLDFKIGEGREFMPQVNKEVNTIQFNYFKDDALVNIKFRDAEKHFKLSSGAELILYNINAVKSESEVIICEGEIDALSFHEMGYRNVVSVPNGANPKTNNLSYLDSCIEIFGEETTFILATDNDAPGKKLRDELAIRFGVEKCFKVDFGEYKDANELLLAEGSQGFINLMKNKKEFPTEGIYSASDIDDEINDYYQNGFPDGCGIGDEEFDEHLKFHRGYITTITGIPGHGKSSFVDYLAVKLNILHGWKFAFYSPESHPLQLHFSFFAEKIIGKPFYGYHKMSAYELDTVKTHFNENFFFVKPEADVSIDNILTKIKSLVKRKGISAFVIDAWNKLDHQYTDSETKYVSQQLDKLTMFCQLNNVHLFLLAHPTKMTKDKQTGKYEVPNLYSISGSSNFFNKTSNGISVYRNFDEDNKKSDIYFQKVKFKHWGKVGMVTRSLDKDSGRYYSDNVDNSNWLRKDPEQKQATIFERGEVVVIDNINAPF